MLSLKQDIMSTVTK